MINPADGSLLFYYSPIFGLVEKFTDFHLLVEAHCPEIAKRLKGNIENIQFPVKSSKELSVGFQRVDIKNSPYSISERINALQRLFDKHILRDWNEDALKYYQRNTGLKLNDNEFHTLQATIERE